jgi:hypothetical protein
LAQAATLPTLHSGVGRITNSLNEFFRYFPPAVNTNADQDIPSN